MQVILNISGKYPLSYNWWRVDKNLRVYLPEGPAPIQNNMFPCTARNKSEHAGRKWGDVCRYNTTHIWKSGCHPLSHALFPFQKKVQALWKCSLSPLPPNKISKSARLTGWDAFINSLATRIRLEVGLTPFLFKKFSMYILFIFYDLSQYIFFEHKGKRISSPLKIIFKMYLIDKEEVTLWYKHRCSCALPPPIGGCQLPFVWQTDGLSS